MTDYREVILERKRELDNLKAEEESMKAAFEAEIEAKLLTLRQIFLSVKDMRMYSDPVRKTNPARVGFYMNNEPGYRYINFLSNGLELVDAPGARPRQYVAHYDEEKGVFWKLRQASNIWPIQYVEIENHVIDWLAERLITE